MVATQFIEEFQKMPPSERAGVLDWILSEADDAVFASFDRLPRRSNLTEEEILILPRRVRPA